MRALAGYWHIFLFFLLFSHDTRHTTRRCVCRLRACVRAYWARADSPMSISARTPNMVNLAKAGSCEQRPSTESTLIVRDTVALLAMGGEGLDRIGRVEKFHCSSDLGSGGLAFPIPNSPVAIPVTAPLVHVLNLEHPQVPWRSAMTACWRHFRGGGGGNVHELTRRLLYELRY